mgnify:CR=1 FL=1
MDRETLVNIRCRRIFHPHNLFRGLRPRPMHGSCQARGVSGRVSNLSISHSCRASILKQKLHTNTQLDHEPLPLRTPWLQGSKILRSKILRRTACAIITACGVRLQLPSAHVSAPAQQNIPPHGMCHCYSVQGEVAVAPAHVLAPAQQNILSHGIRMRMLQRGQSQHPKTPSHHMLSGPNLTPPTPTLLQTLPRSKSV